MVKVQTRCGMTTWWNIIQPYNVMMYDTYYNVGEPWKHDMEQKVPDTKGHILYDSTYMKCL